MDLRIDRISDIPTREALQKIAQEFRDQVLLRGHWDFFQITFAAAVTNFKYPHNLGFLPLDVIQTSLTGAGSLTWNYASFDKNYLSITTTGACVVRAFIGSFSKNS